MEALQNRVDSFAKQKRVKNPAKTSSYVSLKWPHSSKFAATPESLAEAGFYFNPSFEDRDNVTCYICEKQLSDWEVEDDPFDIHWEKCGVKCCWASVRCGLRGDMDRKGGFIFPDKSRLPTSKTMEKARLETFSAGDGWIHDRERNHGANSRKMARAGFVYSPQHPGDDLATCLYCNVSLSGWDADDDPSEEHRKREKKAGSKCPFLDLSEPAPTATSKPPSRAQSNSKPSSKSQPPAKRSRSASASKHQDLVQPTKMHDGDNDNEGNDESDPAPASTSKRVSTKGRTTSGSKPKHARSQSRSGLRNVAEDDEDVVVEEEENVPSTKVKRTTTTAARSRSRSKSVLRPAVDADEDEPLVPKTSSRSRSKAKETAAAVTATEAEEEEEVQALKKSTRGRTNAHTADEPTTVVPQKPSRTKKAEALPDPEPDQDQEVEEKPRTASRTRTKPPSTAPVPRKPSRTKPKPAAIVKNVVSDAEEAEDDENDVQDVVPPKPKRRAASSPKPAPVPAVKTKSTATTKQPNGKVWPKPQSPPQEDPEVIEEIEEARAMDDQGATGETGTDEMDVFVSPRSSPIPVSQPSPPPPQSANEEKTVEELPPLFVPKRKSKLKGAAADTNEKEGRPLTVQAESSKKPSSKASDEPKRSLRGETVKEKGQHKSKDARTGKKTSNMKVVEISTDEEDGDRSPDQPERETEEDYRTNEGSKEKSQARIPVAHQSDTAKENAQEVVNIAEPAKSTKSTVALRSPSPPQPESEDIHMASVDEKRRAEDIEVLQPVKTPETPRVLIYVPHETARAVESDPSIVLLPPLSKLPFAPLQNLTDAELDMTVEEWIRYQMEVEYDKFRRDGERELGRFKRRAEEVRAIIEAL